jgi:hypothetical protein
MPHELTGISDKIPKDYQKTFAHLSGEVLHIREKWREYNKMFGHSQAIVDLLNEGGSFLMWIIDDLFIGDFILSICRLLDPAESYDKAVKSKVPNLSLAYLNSLLEQNGEKALSMQLNNALVKLRTAATALEEHRNKRKAHNDLKIAVAETDLLPPVSRTLIEETIADVKSFLKEFEKHFTGEDIPTFHVDSGGGAELLLTRLAKARAYDRLVADGKIEPIFWRRLAQESGLD